MGILGTASIINGSTNNTPGALALDNDVPAGAQLAIIEIRFDGNTDNVAITSLICSFGDLEILGQTAGTDSNCALAYVLVDDEGSGHTITPTISGGQYFGQIYTVNFLDEVDISSEAAWLRDWDIDFSNGTATATVDTEEGDIVLGATGNYEQSPPLPAGTTSLIGPVDTNPIRVRAFFLDDPESGSAAFSSDNSYGTAVAVSIIPGASGITIDADIEAISLSTLKANVASNRTIAGALEALLLTGNRATVSSNRSIAGATEALSVSTLSATVSSNRSIQTAIESISVQGLPAILSLGIAANSEQITLSTLLATISSNRSMSGQVESLLVSTNPAAISVGSSISAGVEQIALQANAAQVRLNVNLSTQMESILLTELAAQVTLGQAINAGVESLVVTPLGATLTLSTGIQAHLETLKLTTFTAVITSPTSPISVPGLEYTITGDRLHYTLPLNKLHFTFRG